VTLRRRPGVCQQGKVGLEWSIRNSVSFLVCCGIPGACLAKCRKHRRADVEPGRMKVRRFPCVAYFSVCFIILNLVVFVIRNLEVPLYKYILYCHGHKQMFCW
jgi:hypothetical protein